MVKNKTDFGRMNPVDLVDACIIVARAQRAPLPNTEAREKMISKIGSHFFEDDRNRQHPWQWLAKKFMNSLVGGVSLSED